MQAVHGTSEAPPRHWSERRMLMWLGVLWVIGWLSIILEQAISWSDTARGSLNGLVTGAILSPFYSLVLIPVGGIGLWIGSFAPFRKYRTAWAVVLPALLALQPATASIRDRMEPGRRFQRATQVALPHHRQNLHYTFSGGLFADRTDSFVFECPASEADALIKALRLQRSSSFVAPRMALLFPVLAKTPDLEQWEPWEEISHPDILTLYTDKTHTHVQIIYGTI